MEAVLVLPQLHVMQRTRVVEAFTTFYVFFLGVERLLNFTFWLILIVEDFMEGTITTNLYLWFFLFFLSENVPSFFLAYFI
jgi:hypothetical protein